MNSEPSPPAPKKKSICWDFFFALSPDFNIHDGVVENLKKMKKKDVRKAMAALTWKEMDKNVFENCSDAALTLMRAIALMDSTDRKPESMVTVKSYLLMGRAALYLAREAHYKYNIDRAPTGRDELARKHNGASLAKAMQECIFMAAEDSINISLAMSRFVWLTVGQVANDRAKSGRPAMAEAWLTMFQVELMLAEVEASLGQDEATKVRPKDRLGPFSRRDGISDEELAALGPDELEGWRVNIPGQQLNKSQQEGKLYLADYWFGMTETTSARIVGFHCTHALKHLERYRAIATRTLREECWAQERVLEHSLFRMGAAALISLDNTSPESDRQKRKLVVGLRNIFPGTPFKPTEAFCRELITGHPDDPDLKQWNIGCQLGCFGVKNRSMLTVMDTSLNTRWSDMIVGSKIVEGPDECSYYMPTARQLYEVTLDAMAGAGSETRCTAGPPRRPRVVVVSFRLRERFEDLKRLLSNVNVDCVLDSEESLRFACANNNTDFETGGRQQVEQSLIGQRVGICELRNRQELNGRVGRVLRFHKDQGRWEVKLEPMVPGEKAMKIAAKPLNITACPSRFDSAEEYLMYRDDIRSWDVNVEKRNAEDDAAVQALLDKLLVQDEITNDSVCAICQENTDETTESNATLLPCGHSFHLDCILPWVSQEKLECPVCREKF